MSDLTTQTRQLVANPRGLCLLGVAIALVHVAFLAPGIYSIDGNSMLGVAESLVERHTLTVPAELGVTGRGGATYSPWYPLLSFVAVPFVAPGIALAHALNLPTHFVAAIGGLVVSALLSAATAPLLALVALRLGSSWRGAWLAAVSYALGTIAVVYAREFFAEPLLAFLTLGGLYLALCETPGQVLGSAGCAALSVLAKPTGIVLGPILSLYLLARRRPAATSLMPLLGSIAGFGVYGVYNYFRFGNLLRFGQPFEFSLANIPVGMTGLLLSPGRGLIWYCPAVILVGVCFRAAFRSKRLETLLIAAIFLAYLSIHSLWRYWAGGWSWGPRFLLPALPGLSALLGLLEGKWVKALVVLTAVGFLINAPTLVSFYDRYYAEAYEQGVSDSALLWSPREAPLIHGWAAARHQIHDAAAHDVVEMFRERGENHASKIEASRALRVVAVWWWVLPVAHISRWLGATVAAALLVTGVVLLSLSFSDGSGAAGQASEAFH